MFWKCTVHFVASNLRTVCPKTDAATWLLDHREQPKDYLGGAEPLDRSRHPSRMSLGLEFNCIGPRQRAIPFCRVGLEKS